MQAARTSPPFFPRTLRDLNTDDLLRASGLTALAGALPGLRRLFDGPSLVLAQLLHDFDSAVGRGEGGAAALALLRTLGTKLAVTGSPVGHGPRLFVANHPGLGDFLALLSALDSPGLKVVARERAFLRALPYLADRLLEVPERGAWAVLKQVSKHLANGGSVLTFPAGRIEPDPAWSEPLLWNAWSTSTALWARSVPELVVQPALVAGVRARAFVDPWLARWRRDADDRDWTAAVLQLVCQVLWARPRTSRIELALGTPIAGALFKGPEGQSALAAQLTALSRGLRREPIRK